MSRLVVLKYARTEFHQHASALGGVQDLQNDKFSHFFTSLLVFFSLARGWKRAKGLKIVESQCLVSILTVSVSSSKPSLVLIRNLRSAVALFSLVVIKYYDNDYDLKALGREG